MGMSESNIWHGTPSASNVIKSYRNRLLTVDGLSVSFTRIVCGRPIPQDQALVLATVNYAHGGIPHNICVRYESCDQQLCVTARSWGHHVIYICRYTTSCVKNPRHFESYKCCRIQKLMSKYRLRKGVSICARRAFSNSGNHVPPSQFHFRSFHTHNQREELASRLNTTRCWRKPAVLHSTMQT